MLLTISTTHEPATDLGYLLHKHPERLQTFSLAFGRAHVFYPEASEHRCTAALLLDLDPVALVRGSSKRSHVPLDQYVNDRPYASTSFMSVAISQVFGSALSGRSRDRPALAGAPLPLAASVSALPDRGDETLRGLFEPLGYGVAIERDPEAPGYVNVRLEHDAVTVSSLLGHLYVLIGALDGKKHYFVGADEVEKLLRHGAGWLEAHPMREAIASRYLTRRRPLVRDALERLEELEGLASGDALEDETAERVDEKKSGAAEQKAPPVRRVHDERLDAIADAIARTGARRVLDLGCGEGKLIRALMKRGGFAAIVGVDVSSVALERAARKLKLGRIHGSERDVVELIHGSLVYRDRRLEGFDAAALVEVIEHLDEGRLGALERCVFEFARPGVVFVTTPNRDYNHTFEGWEPGVMRHADHRFEWSRDEFAAWCERVAGAHGYEVERFGLGDEHPTWGSITQGARFTRGGGEAR